MLKSLAIKCYISVYLSHLLYFILSFLANLPSTFSSNVLCPPYSDYLTSGDNCVFVLESCGDSTHARQRCKEESGTIISLIYTQKHFDEVCEFAKRRLPAANASFYLGAHRNGKQFVWDMYKRRVSFETPMPDNGHECLEMIVSRSRCYLDDAPCNETKWPVCEFPRVNPCRYNNGGCAGICVPQHRGHRKCVCFPGFNSIGTRCENVVEEKVTVTCPAKSVHIKAKNLCVGLNKDKLNHLKSNWYCLDKFGLDMLSQLTAEAASERYYSILQSLTSETVFHIGLTHNPTNKSFQWVAGSSIVDNVKLCSSDQTSDGYCVALNMVDRCYEIIDCELKKQSICQVDQPNACLDYPSHDNNGCKHGFICAVKSGYRQYKCDCKPGYYYNESTQICDDINECKLENGGCHQRCRNTVGSRECSCWLGYQLVDNTTECRYKDSCMVKGSGNGCPQITVNEKKCKRNTKHDNNDNNDPEEHGIPATYLFIILGVIACFVIITITLYCSKVMRGSRKEPQHTDPPLPLPERKPSIKEAVRQSLRQSRILSRTSTYI